MEGKALYRCNSRRDIKLLQETKTRFTVSDDRFKQKKKVTNMWVVQT